MNQPILDDTSASQVDRFAAVVARRKDPQVLETARPLHRQCPVCHSRFGVVLGQLKYALFASSPLAA